MMQTIKVILRYTIYSIYILQEYLQAGVEIGSVGIGSVVGVNSSHTHALRRKKEISSHIK